MISCATCKNVDGEGLCIPGASACLTQDPAWELCRLIMGTKHDYRMWEAIWEAIDPSECDGGSCDTSCDMNCQEEFSLEQDQFVDDFNFAKPKNKDFIKADFDEEKQAFIRPEPKVEEDVVLHPNHYAEADIPSGIECWDWYELAMTAAEVTGHFKGNALKYIFRAGKKGDAIEDLEKARNYLARWIGYLKGDRTVHMRGKKNDG